MMCFLVSPSPLCKQTVQFLWRKWLVKQCDVCALSKQKVVRVRREDPHVVKL